MHHTPETLHAQILAKNTCLCVGLDTDLARLPKHLLRYDDPVFEFNKQIIDATKDYCVAYKPNLAFYEARGLAGWRSLERTLQYMPEGHFVIADAKRGDIGNTSRLYAQAFFEAFPNIDALTVAPYMGADSVTPFLAYEGKWVIVLALTSNPGSADFQQTPQENGEPLWAKVMRRCCEWAGPDRMMFVVGATHPERFAEVRAVAPEHFLLVPGVGAQGGDMATVVRHGRNAHTGLLVNASREILYASDGEDFAEKAAEKAKGLGMPV